MQLFQKVRLPGRVPSSSPALRLGVARALVGVVVAELFGARAGLGFLILSSTQTFDTAGLFVGVLDPRGRGHASVELLKYLEREASLPGASTKPTNDMPRSSRRST